MYILIDVLIVEGSPWRSAGAHNFYHPYNYKRHIL